MPLRVPYPAATRQGIWSCVQTIDRSANLRHHEVMTSDSVHDLQSTGSATAVPYTPSAAYGCGPVAAWRLFVAKYFRLSGRASRAEFWWWLLGFALVSVLLSFVSRAVVPAPTSADPAVVFDYSLRVSMLQLIWAALNFIGAIALTVRRLHDIGLSGWWWFVQLVPVVGSLAMIVLVALPSRAYGSRFDDVRWR